MEFEGPTGYGQARWGAHRERGSFSLDSPTVPSRVLSIGVLRGGWREMGRQYGTRAAGDIAAHWDVDWEDRVVNGAGVWARSRDTDARQRYRVRYLQRSWREVAALSPELCEFMTGIADGASEALASAHYGPDVPDPLKILFLNESDAALHPAWDFDRDMPGDGVRTQPGCVDYQTGHDNQDDGCNGYWVDGRGTSDGHALAQRAVQAGMNRTVTAVSYVAVPQDPAAHPYWAVGRAGCIGGLGAMLNDRGVCVLTSGSQGGDVDRTLAPGVKDFILAAYGVIFSGTAAEAAERVTRGSARYRERTGRATVLRFRGANILFGDPHAASVVESNARNYCVRSTAPAGADSVNTLVIANHFVADTSYDEHGQRHSAPAMRDFEPGRAGSRARYRTGVAWLDDNYGTISIQAAKDFAGTHGNYDDGGVFRAFRPEPGQESETWCAHRWSAGNEQLPLGDDGNNITTVFDLTTREAWYVVGWPCHYREWHLEWNHVNLADYVGVGDATERPDD